MTNQHCSGKVDLRGVLKLWPIFGNERRMCGNYHGYVAEFGGSCVRLPSVNQGRFLCNERIIFLISELLAQENKKTASFGSDALFSIFLFQTESIRCVTKRRRQVHVVLLLLVLSTQPSRTRLQQEEERVYRLPSNVQQFQILLRQFGQSLGFGAFEPPSRIQRGCV